MNIKYVGCEGVCCTISGKVDFSGKLLVNSLIKL
jgi:hypothetical protein